MLGMRIFIAAVLVIACVVSFGQTKTYVGVKGGAHINSAFFNHTIFRFSSRTSFDPGVNAGLFIKHFPRKRDIAFNSGIQGGINYMQRGWAQTFPDTNIPDYGAKMNYLEIPIEGVGYFGRKNKYFIAAGFFTEILVGNTLDTDPGDVSPYDFATYVPSRDREIGYGGRASGGVWRDFPFGSLHLEAFFTYSFSNFIDAGDLTDDQVPDISNLWSLGISVGYLLPFGKLELVK